MDIFVEIDSDMVLTLVVTSIAIILGCVIQATKDKQDRVRLIEGVIVATIVLFCFLVALNGRYTEVETDDYGYSVGFDKWAGHTRELRPIGMDN